MLTFGATDVLENSVSRDTSERGSERKVRGETEAAVVKVACGGAGEGDDSSALGISDVIPGSPLAGGLECGAGSNTELADELAKRSNIGGEMGISL
jgi:hypothetical protein